MSENALSLKARDICDIGPVIPVLVIDDAADSKPLGEALLAGGVKVLEITLRTPAALDAISAAAEISGAVVGAGTVLTKADLLNAKSAGATFAVSPGANDDLVAAAIDEDFPLLPGAITPSEAMSLSAKGFKMLKFFPAEIAGGTKMLKAMGSVFSDIAFCPTGGIALQRHQIIFRFQTSVVSAALGLRPKIWSQIKIGTKSQQSRKPPLVFSRPQTLAWICF